MRHFPIRNHPYQFKDEAGWKVARPQDAMLRGKWWEIFHDQELNALEDQLNIDNQNIKVYFENFMLSRAMIAAAASQLYPTLTMSPAYSRSRGSGFVSGSSGVVGTGNSSSGNKVSTFMSIPFDISWAAGPLGEGAQRHQPGCL